MSGARHIPVMAREVVDALQPRDGGRYVDGTFGAGGYSSALLDRADCRVIAIDRDPISPMPIGLINSLNEKEVANLMAFLISGGNKADKIFAK